MYNSHELPYIVMQQTKYRRNDVTTKQKNFDHPQTLAPTNKNDWTVIIVMTRSCGLAKVIETQSFTLLGSTGQSVRLITGPGWVFLELEKRKKK